jgi:Ser-tRNA(Ala) deacylase AlaX
MWFMFIWNNKAWILLAVVIAAAGIYISYIRIDNNIKTASLVSTKVALNVVVESNKILVQNAAAIETQNKKMKEIAASAEKLRLILKDITEDARKALRNESITRFNDCAVAYGNTGVLPEGCGSLKANLPVTSNTGKTDWRRKSP